MRKSGRYNSRKKEGKIKTMKKHCIKILSAVLAICMCFALLPATVFAAGQYDGKTVILYSANLRGNIDALPKLAALKNEFAAKGADVILVDTGNYLQGSVYSTYDSGKTVIALMDTAGYDVVGIGSHEFDFGSGVIGVEQHGVIYADDTLGKLLEDASFDAVSANAVIIEGCVVMNVFEPTATVTSASGFEVGFFGLTDPDTVNHVLESNLGNVTFRNGAATAQSQVSSLSGCNIIVGLSNLGTLAGIEGAVMIDVSSGTGLTVGAVIIDNKTGAVDSRETIDLGKVTPDKDVNDAVNAAKTLIDAEYPSVAKSEVTLNGSMFANRSGETNTGDLWTDALLWFATEGGIESYYDEDEIANGNTGIAVDAANIVAVWNGGNLRDYLNSGDVTMKDIQRVLPYPNKVAVAYITGAQLLELLEAATQGLPYTGGSSAALASFAQVAGIKYSVDATIAYDAGEAYGNNWFKANSVNRVKIGSVNGKAFDVAATYAVITSNAVANGMDSNYICLEKDPDLSTITSATVADVVWLYITKALGGVIGNDYAAPQGRITVKTPDYADENDVLNILMKNVGIDVSAPDKGLTRAELITALYKLAGAPVMDAETAFTDVSADAAYCSAVKWAVAKRITSGTSATTFSPDSIVTRQELAVFLYNFSGGYDGLAMASEEIAESAEIAEWAKSGVDYCVGMGYIELSGQTFNPAGVANRAVIVRAITVMCAD